MQFRSLVSLAITNVAMRIRSMVYNPHPYDWDTKCTREYGMVWRVKGCCGVSISRSPQDVICSTVARMQEDMIELSDPKALQYIFHKSGYNFLKTAVVRQIAREINGTSLSFAQGGRVRGFLWSASLTH